MFAAPVAAGSLLCISRCCKHCLAEAADVAAARPVPKANMGWAHRSWCNKVHQLYAWPVMVLSLGLAAVWSDWHRGLAMLLFVFGMKPCFVDPFVGILIAASEVAACVQSKHSVDKALHCIHTNPTSQPFMTECYLASDERRSGWFRRTAIQK